jgi:hypothetical protein
LKLAVTERAWLIVTSHAPVPAHAPDQPANVEHELGVAVSVTAVPASYVAWQVAPQSMPAGLLVTAPAPAPAFETVSWKVCGATCTA